MPYYTQSPLDVGLGAAGAFLSAQQQKKQQDLLNKQAEEQIRQQAALAAAQQAESNRRLSDQETTEKFNEGLYAPGQYRTLTTTGKYQQGPNKGKPKTMTRQELIPGTGGIEWQRDAAAIAASNAENMVRQSTAELNKARIPEQLALAYYYRTKPGLEEQRIYEQAKAHAAALQAKLASGRSSGLTTYQMLNLQREVEQANAAAQDKYQSMVQHAQDHADAMNISAGIAGQPQNYQPTVIQQPQPIIITLPNGQTIGAPQPTQSTGGLRPAPTGAKPGQQFRNKTDGKTYEVGKDGLMHPVQASASMGFGKF